MKKERTCETHGDDSASEDQNQEPDLGIRDGLLETNKDRLLDQVIVAVILAGETILRKSGLGLVKERSVVGIVGKKNIAEEADNDGESTFDDEDPSLQISLEYCITNVWIGD